MRITQTIWAHVELHDVFGLNLRNLASSPLPLATQPTDICMSCRQCAAYAFAPRDSFHPYIFPHEAARYPCTRLHCLLSYFFCRLHREDRRRTHRTPLDTPCRTGPSPPCTRSRYCYIYLVNAEEVMAVVVVACCGMTAIFSTDRVLQSLARAMLVPTPSNVICAYLISGDRRTGKGRRLLHRPRVPRRRQLEPPGLGRRVPDLRGGDQQACT